MIDNTTNATTDNGSVVDYQEQSSFFVNYYKRLKSDIRYKNAIVIFDAGDFFFSMHDDAVKLSIALGTILTRSKSGYPVTGSNSNIDRHLPKLSRAGLTVAIVTQIVK